MKNKSEKIPTSISIDIGTTNVSNQTEKHYIKGCVRHTILTIDILRIFRAESQLSFSVAAQTGISQYNCIFERSI